MKEVQKGTSPYYSEDYWLGDVTGPVSQTFQIWGKYLVAQIPKVTKPFLDYRRTISYDATKSATFEEEWNKLTEGGLIELTSQNIIVGEQGEALHVAHISKWYNVPESMPHITLLINNFKAKELGPMLKPASQTTWV